MHGNIVTLCGMSSFVMLSEDCFSKRRVKKGTACREGMVSQGDDMKVYLEGFEKHHETGGVLHQKNTVNLFTHTVAFYTAVSCSIHYILHTHCFLTFLTWPTFFGNKCRDILKTKALTRQKVYKFFNKTTLYLQDIVSGSWFPSLSVVDRVVASSPASASGSTCAQ